MKAKKQLEKLKQEAGENLAGWQRAKADYENLKKQSESERQEFVKYANSNLIMELLPIYDNFKLAFGNVPKEEQNDSWVVGLQHIMKQMQDFLESNGVEAIKTNGEQFDPELHEAVEAVENEEFEAGQIIKTIKSGYRLNNKVIQVAKVVVCEKKIIINNNKVMTNSEIMSHFKDNGDGSWTCIKPFEMSGPNGKVRVEAGNTIRKGVKFMGVDIVSLLENLE